MNNGLQKVQSGEIVQSERVEQLTPMALMQMAIERGADVDQLSKLMDLQDRYEEREARKAYNFAMAEFKKNAPRLTKNKNVSFKATSYDHATLDHITDLLNPVLHEHGLSFSWRTEQADQLITVTCVVTHILGHKEQTSLSGQPDMSGAKNNIQAIGSTTSYLQRYTLLAALGLATTGQDDDAVQSVGPITEKQFEALQGLIDETKSDVSRFCHHFEIGFVKDLPSSRFDEARTLLESKRK